MFAGGSQDADRLFNGNLSSYRCYCVEECNQSVDRQQQQQQPQQQQNQNRRSPPPPHCVTCCCLSTGTIKCRLPASAGRCGSEQRQREAEIPLDYNGEDYTGAAKLREQARRRRRRRDRGPGTTSSAVDEILREMSLCTSVALSDEELDIDPRRRDSEEDSDLRRQQQQQQQQQQQSNVGMTVTRIRSCERWPVRKRDDEKDEDKAPTGTETNSPLALDLNADDPLITAESSSSLKDLVTTTGGAGGVSELRQVRRQFIERICQQARKLHRLQRHLDDCATPSPMPRRTRSVSTMTSSRNKRESLG